MIIAHDSCEIRERLARFWLKGYEILRQFLSCNFCYSDNYKTPSQGK